MFGKWKLLLIVVAVKVLLVEGILFICDDATSIDINKLCDGKDDCRDGSDETAAACFRLICPKNKFRCKYGGCIHKAERCNGNMVCKDGSDEKYCGEEMQCGVDESNCYSTKNCIKKNQMCDGVRDCDDGSDEEEESCRDRRCPRGTFRCQRGGCIYDDCLCDDYPDCPDGSDETKHLCKHFKCVHHRNCSAAVETTCKPITAHNLDAVCISETLGYVPCNEDVPIGTVATLECKKYYIPSNGNSEAFCQADGNWNANILQCKPECGISDSGGRPLIVHGENITNWPWHAVIYGLQNGKWLPFCGGTLISEHIVLTAAHCTWKKSLALLKFAFSKYDYDVDVVDDFTQFRSVSQVFMPPEYQDYRSNYGSDIAAVLLSEPVVLSDYVKPTCVDWNLRNIHHYIVRNQMGTIAGMGLTDDNHPSKRLKSVAIPVVLTSICIKNHRTDFRKYITRTTFCAGWANGTNVCNGDSGGGLLFRDANNPRRWILQGVASVSARREGSSDCDTSRYAIFTKVSLYLHWLKFEIKLEF